MRLSHLVLLIAALCTSCQPIASKTGNIDIATIYPVVIATRDLPTIIGAGQASTPEVSPALVTEGLQIYRDQYCGICHQLTAAGTGGTFGPTHDGLAAVATQRIQDPSYQGAATTLADYLRESLIEPQRYIVPGYELTPHSMPSYSFLTAQQLDALVQFLHQQ
jgi:mono/diheme cytochrome c family protein